MTRSKGRKQKAPQKFTMFGRKREKKEEDAGMWGQDAQKTRASKNGKPWVRELGMGNMSIRGAALRGKAGTRSLWRIVYMGEHGGWLW